MANKVISIKLDEKDIARLKKYHEALIGLGIVSDKTLSMNALYKHLLLDYLEDDIRKMVANCASMGMLPKYISPEEIDEGKFSFANVYGLDEENFSAYMQCIKEFMVKGLDNLEKNIDLINGVAKTETVLFERDICQILEVPKEYCDYETYEDSFWFNKALEEQCYCQEEFRKKGVADDFDMIKNASIPDEAKEKLICAIEQHEKDKRNNFNIVRGRANLDL